MYPDKEPHLSSNGSYSNHKPATSTSTTTAEECCHANAEDSTKETKERSNEGLPNTPNSATICPDHQCMNWPAIGMYPSYPYAYNGAFYYTPPPYMLNPSSCNFPYPNVAVHPPYCSNENATSSGGSGGSSAQTHLNESVKANSNHVLMNAQNCYPYPPYPYPQFTYPPLYPPNSNMFVSSPLSLPVIHAGQMLATKNIETNRVQSTNHLCSNCSRDIIPTVDEPNIDEISKSSPPLNITSFRDSMGRVWRCSSIKNKKISSSKAKETDDNSSAVGSLTASERKKSALRVTVASPSLEQPTTGREDGALPLRKKKTKLRGRKVAEGVTAVKTLHRSPSRSTKSKPSVTTKATIELHHTGMEVPSSSGNTIPNSKLNKKPTKEAISNGDVSASTRDEGHESLPHNNPNPKKAHSAPAEEPDHKPVGREKDASVGPTKEENKKQRPPPPPPGPVENSVLSGPSTSLKHTKGEEDVKTIEIHEKASFNDYLKKLRTRKDTSTSLSESSEELKDEDFWSSPSSLCSSGTYDDSEAFDSFKLLNEATINPEELRDNRQRSRDRLFRRKVVGFVKVTNAQSEEGMKKQRRCNSPRAKVGDDKPKEQILIDTSQLRITEETPKRFIVESKDGASTTQNSMTITLQADMPRPSPRGTCDYCRSGGKVGATTLCTCNLPPCQRPQWQAPPCPANEIHGTPVHHCHNMPCNGRSMQPQTHIQRHRECAHSRNEPDDGDIPFVRETPVMRELDAYHSRIRRANLQNFGLVTPWNQRNVDRPREENRHPHYIAPHPSTERVDVRRDHSLPTNRTRRWHTQSELSAETRSNRQAQEMLRIQIPNSFPRYRPYEYGRNHNEEPLENHEGIEENVENRARGSIDINIFRNNGGVRRLGTIRRVLRGTSPRETERLEEPTPQDEDPESNLEFYRRPRSAITVSKTNYFSPRNRKLEEEVQRIQSANYVRDVASSSKTKEGNTEYPNNKDCCDQEQEFEDREKADCEYDEVDGCSRDPDGCSPKRDPASHRDINDEDDE